MQVKCSSYDISSFVNVYHRHEHYFQYQESLFVPNTSVKGRLKTHISFWEEINCSKAIRDVILNGYNIPFIHTPESVFLKNNKSAVDNMPFVMDAVTELVTTGRVIEVPFQPLVVNPLTVSINRSGKKRLILDLRHVNKYVWKEKMRFEDVKLSLDLLEESGFMFKFDLSSGYHHIDIAPNCQTFLGFSLNKNGEIRHFVYTVLPFGLSSAGFIFTKVLRELVKYWRTNGIKIIVYLDDGWSIADCYNKAMQNSDFVKLSLEKSGFVANAEKSVWVPVQRITWLGHLYDLKSGLLSVTLERTRAFKMEISNLFECRDGSITARKLAKVVGMIASMHFVLGDLSRLMTRSLYVRISRCSRWDSAFTIFKDSAEFTELLFWSQNIDNLNKRNLFPTEQLRISSVSVYSDASDIACAAFSPDYDRLIAHRSWSSSEAQKSSTWRELKCIEWGLQSFSSVLKNRTVQWFTDSKNCEIIVRAGSGNLQLHAIALSIFNICKEHTIRLSVFWIPREQNARADWLSRLVDTEDWGVSKQFFRFISSMWGPFTIDRFANFQNRQTLRFNSRFWNPESEAIDAFSQNWKDENNWLVPPISLVCKTISHVVKCRAVGVLVVPRWQSAAFWPLLFDDQFCAWKSYVKDVLEFCDRDIFVHGQNKKSLFGSKYFKGSVLAVRLDGT